MQSNHACRPEWHQTTLASPAQQQQPRLVQHQASPQARYLVLATPQPALPATAADSNRHVTVCSTAQQARYSAPAGKHQRQSRKMSQGLSKTVKAKVQLVLNKVLLPRSTSSPQCTGQSTEPATASGPASVSRGRYPPAGHQRLKSHPASDAVQDASAAEPVSQQAQAITASAHAVLRGLDWADSQLSCSTSLLAVSNLAHMCSMGSSDQHNITIAAAAAATGESFSRVVAEPLLNAAELTFASGNSSQKCDKGPEAATLAQLAQQVPPERGSDVAACHETGQQQAEQAGVNSRSQGTVVQQSKPRGCIPASEVADSGETWSEKEDNCQRECSPCAPRRQVQCKLSMHPKMGLRNPAALLCTICMDVWYAATKCMGTEVFSS